MKTIRQLAGQFGLSRSTLLYYDRCGLLRPDYRTGSGQRLYSTADEDRLNQICQLRKAGLPLAEIDAVLESNTSFRVPLRQALHRRLTAINREISTLRKQQQVVVALLKEPAAMKRSRIMNKARWVQLLDAIGLDDGDKELWHAEFERVSPEAHQDFLESLGIAEAEIGRIRRAAASANTARPRRQARTL